MRCDVRRSRRHFPSVLMSRRSFHMSTTRSERYADLVAQPQDHSSLLAPASPPSLLRWMGWVRLCSEDGWWSKTPHGQEREQAITV